MCVIIIYLWNLQQGQGFVSQNPFKNTFLNIYFVYIYDKKTENATFS